MDCCVKGLLYEEERMQLIPKLRVQRCSDHSFRLCLKQSPTSSGIADSMPTNQGPIKLIHFIPDYHSMAFSSPRFLSNMLFFSPSN